MRTPKWLKWEFWPFWLFYTPVYFYWFYLSVRARSLTFFTAANPGMRFGGFVDYSKYDILRRLPASVLPPSFLLPPGTTTAQVEAILREAGIAYPVILKPDRGERGFGVAKLHNTSEVDAYLRATTTQTVLQPYIDLPEEYGILYHRLPESSKGTIHSVVEKEFLRVTGDGTRTLEDLFEEQERTRYHLHMLRHLYADRLSEVLPAGETLQLVAIGNHARGTTFRDANHRISPALIEVFDRISQQVEGFYFGRYDLRAQSFEHVLRGEFQVIELNGVNSEPAHIYDPNYPLLKAYRDMFHHWKSLYRVAQAARRKGHKAAPFQELVRAVRRHQAHKRRSKTP